MWDVEPYTLDLSDVVKLSDGDLLAISAANPDLRIERSATGPLEIMSRLVPHPAPAKQPW